MDEREQKQLLMDLEVVMKSNECPCIVQFYGALFKEVSLEDTFEDTDVLTFFRISVRVTVGFAWSSWTPH